MRHSVRKGFTLIEVLVSVALIAVVVLGILAIRQRTLSSAHYLQERMRGELINSLFLSDEALRYDGAKKSAYTLLKSMGIRKEATVELLRKTQRRITISAPLPLGELPLPIILRAVMLRGEYPSRFYRFSLGQSPNNIAF